MYYLFSKIIYVCLLVVQIQASKIWELVGRRVWGIHPLGQCSDGWYAHHQGRGTRNRAVVADS